MSDKSSKSCLFIGKGREENNYSVVADTICNDKTERIVDIHALEKMFDVYF